MPLNKPTNQPTYFKNRWRESEKKQLRIGICTNVQKNLFLKIFFTVTS